MNKKYVHHVWRKFRPISYWYFFAAFVVFLTIGIIAMRQNNLNAIKLRDHVLEVDKKDGDTEKALRELREYVYGHMNTDLSAGTGVQQPVQLKYRYERLVTAEKKRVDALNGNVYTQAQHLCEKKFPTKYGGPRVPCITEYVTKHGAAQKTIPDALYKFDFASPVWSPDLAGFSLLLSGLCLILFLIRFGLERWFRYELDN